ncbi:histone deacetylase family protein [Neisseria sp. S1]|uniref:histone deacetylase family protein n=1 Tax=Neisseria sp. S1 TaxID=3318354 RepID=UPI003A88D2D1
MRAWIRRLLGRKPRLLWIGHPLFLQHDPGTDHPEAAARIGAIEAELLRQKISPRIRRAEAAEVTDKQLALVHTSKYLQYLESVRPQPGKIYRLDDDTVMSSETLAAARYGAGAVVQAVDTVLSGRSPRAFCAVRPPGHHAESAKAGGFCLINNVAVGAMRAIAEHRLQRIAIVDFDVHHNNGTLEIFKDDPRVMLLNSCAPDLYPFPDEGVGGRNPHIHNIFLPSGSGSREMREAVRRLWLPQLALFKPQLLLLSAGFDAHRKDESGSLNWHEADYAWLTHKLVQAAGEECRGVVSVLEGGYHLESLAKSVAAHLYVLSGMGKPACAVAYDKWLRRTAKKEGRLKK